jgi:membrane protease YdiL (CAAX protease family)
MEVIAFRMPADAPSWKRWLVYSPVARILIFATLAAALLFAAHWASGWLGLNGKDAPVVPRRLAFFFKQVVPMLSAYLFLACVIERRRPAELQWRKVRRDLIPGVFLGALLIGTVVAALWLVGSYEVQGTHPEFEWWAPLLIGGLGTGIAEELVFRGVIFRISEEGLGTWPALALSALLFGALHLGNPGATAWSSIAIAVEAGLLLGLVYHVSRSLPLCIGIHTGWNFTEGAVFGIPVSGGGDTGWLVSTRPGPDWLTGGVFGAEASVIAVAISSVVSLALVAHALRTRSIARRHWRTRPIMDAKPSQGAPC